MIIDAHTHLLARGHWPAAWWDHVAVEWAAAAPNRTPAEVRDRIEPGLIDEDGARMVERMDDSDVAMSVILPIDFGPDMQSAADIEAANDHAVAMSAAYPGRFLSFAGVDPRRPDALEALSTRIDRGEVKGLKLYPGCGWEPASDRAMEMYALANEADIPVLFHTGDPLPILDREMSNPIHLLPVVEAFPGLKVWLGHAGAPDWWEEACTVAERSENVRLEMSVWLWEDPTDEDRAHWFEHMVKGRDRLGAERLLFGSDHVSGRRVRGEGFLETIVDAYKALPETGHFSQDEVDAILGGNARADLKI